MRSGTRVAAAVLLGWGVLACDPSEHQLFSVQGGAGVPQGGAGSGGTHPDAGLSKLDASVIDDDSGTGPLYGPDLDPDQRFEWPETPPGTGACEPGAYTGSFSCDFRSGGVFGHLEGPIELRLVGAAETQLAIDPGTIAGYAGGATQVWRAKLAGTLDCPSAAFEASTRDEETMEEPQAFQTLISVPPWSTLTVTGTLSGALDPEALVIAGEITLTTDSGARCRGGFSARAAL